MLQFKNYILILCISFLLRPSFAQTKLESKKIFSGSLKTEKSNGNESLAIIPYKNELLHINFDVANVLKNYFIIGAYSDQVYSGFSIDRMNVSTKKIQNIPILNEFKGHNIIFSDYLIKNDNLKVFFKEYNKAKRTDYMYCTELDLNTNKTTTCKIFENKKKGNGIKNGYSKTVFNKDNNTVAFVDLRNMGKNIAFDYVLKDFDLKILDYGENITIDDIEDNDISNFTFCKNNTIVFNTIKREKRGNLFKAAKYSTNVYLIKNNKVNKVKLAVSNYFSNVYLLNNNNNEPIVVMNYGDERNELEGLYVAGIDLNTFELINTNKIKYDNLNIGNDKKSESAQNRKEKKDISQLKDNNNKITQVSFAPNGDLYILEETKVVSTVTTTTTSRTGTTSTTRTYYNYGPGVVHCIDGVTNDHRGFVKLDYNFRTSLDMGAGISFVAGADKKIWVPKLGEYYMYELDNSSKKYFANSGETVTNFFMAWANVFKKASKRKGVSMFTTKDKAYTITKSTKKIDISEIVLK